MAAQCVTKVELNISCDNLLDKDIGSKSDPLCVLFLNTSGQQWYEVERTERIKNCLNPKFSKTFIIDYYFEVVQKLKFGIYDIDNKTIELSDDDFLGECECTLGQIVSSKKLTRPLALKNGRPAGKGSITISAEEIKDNRIVLFEMEARKLDNKVALVVKNLPANAGDIRAVDSIPGSGRSPGGGLGNHSSILAWRIPWTKEPGRLQSIESQSVGHDWSTDIESKFSKAFSFLEKGKATHSSILAWRIPWTV